MIVLDAVFFQHGRTGIARVWHRLLSLWALGPFAQDIVVVDRAGTCPVIPGIRTVPAPRHHPARVDQDRILLQQICDAVGARWFLSTYYTLPVATPSIFMCYDMIPEVLGYDLNQPMWRIKTQAIREARAFIAISHNSAVDLLWFHPHLATTPGLVAHCGTDFTPAPAEAVAAFRRAHGLERPYFMLSGTRSGYKNALLVFRALHSLGARGHDVGILCSGGAAALEAELQALAGRTPVRVLNLDDAELQAAYTGSLALCYPSLYEGFGLPPLEAMACGTPVLTTPAAAIAEVCGEAAIYVAPRNTAGFTREMARVLDDGTLRATLAARGTERARLFTWMAMADRLRAFLGSLSASVSPRSAP